eukprot:1161056-Pelagomonas_calceolata.AAC.6
MLGDVHCGVVTIPAFATNQSQNSHTASKQVRTILCTHHVEPRPWRGALRHQLRLHLLRRGDVVVKGQQVQQAGQQAARRCMAQLDGLDTQ